MFNKENIKFNVMFYMLIFLGWAFIDGGSMPPIGVYILHPVIFVSILLNSLWLLANVMFDKSDKK